MHYFMTVYPGFRTPIFVVAGTSVMTGFKRKGGVRVSTPPEIKNG
jgi:hypothetical protein